MFFSPTADGSPISFGLFQCLSRSPDDGDVPKESQLASKGKFAGLDVRDDDVADRGVSNDVPSTGLRRDRTSMFTSMRSCAFKAGAAPRKLPSPAAQEASFAISEFYEDAHQAQASLASKMAQHLGMVQFGTDFAGRAPPMELRMMVPSLEEAIENLIDHLGTLIDQLQELDLPFSGQASLLRATFEADFRNRLSESKTLFAQQCEKLRNLMASSPLLAPASPAFSEKLAAAVWSTCSTSSSPSLTWSPRPLGRKLKGPVSPSSSKAQGKVLSDEMEDKGSDADDSEVFDKDGAFSSLFSVKMVVEDVDNSFHESW